MYETCLNLNGKDVRQLLEDVRTAREAFFSSTTENKEAMEQRLEEALRELANFCRIYDSTWLSGY
jgi:cell division septum initiation protein DivIVA